MRFVKRGSVSAPEELLGPASLGGKELKRFTDYYDPQVKKKIRKRNGVKKEVVPQFSAYKSDGVKARLHKLFHGKCAYCESFFASTAPVDVEHYRPKGNVEERPDHGGYWWLAMDWENLLPSCIDCNRRREQTLPELSHQLTVLMETDNEFNHSVAVKTGKHDCFPVLGTHAEVGASTADYSGEYALLLNPCVDRPDEHLTFYIDRDCLIGLVLPQTHEKGGVGLDQAQVDALCEPLRTTVRTAKNEKLSLRGSVSINTYGLNRLGLVQERTRILRQLEFLEMLALEMGVLAQRLERKAVTRLNTPENKLRVTDDLPDIAQRLFCLQAQILKEMKNMAKPAAPYSMMVNQWLEGFKERLKQPH